METVLHKLMDQKRNKTVEFFSHIYGKAPNADAIRLLMGSTVLVLPPAAGSAYGGRQNAYLLTGSP